MIRYCENLSEKRNTADISEYNAGEAAKVRSFHESLDSYGMTPLRSLDNLASSYGVGRVFVKDESYRFGLNAFKGLGGSYAIYRETQKNADIDTVITATDGNHGRGVAWSARNLGLNSVVYMPKGTARERLDNILALGADASILELNYDGCVSKAREDAEKNGWTLIQDTSWPGYEETPKYIMQGYTTMALEALEQMDGILPTHIFLQAGVGSMAASVTAFFTDYMKDRKPVITIVEPHEADCVYKTAKANDGKIHICTGEMKTIMAGLACGVPCGIAWEILESYADFFVSIPDETAAEGMRILAANKIVSGESGASAFGFFCNLMSDASLKELKNKMSLGKDSVVLFFSTEGATDRENYKKIVGENPTEG